MWRVNYLPNYILSRAFDPVWCKTLELQNLLESFFFFLISIHNKTNQRKVHMDVQIRTIAISSLKKKHIYRGRGVVPEKKGTGTQVQTKSKKCVFFLLNALRGMLFPIRCHFTQLAKFWDFKSRRQINADVVDTWLVLSEPSLLLVWQRQRSRVLAWLGSFDERGWK